MEPEAEIIRAQLFALQDEAYRTFHSALMPTVPPETVKISRRRSSVQHPLLNVLSMFTPCAYDSISKDSFHTVHCRRAEMPAGVWKKRKTSRRNLRLVSF